MIIKLIGCAVSIYLAVHAIKYLTEAESSPHRNKKFILSMGSFLLSVIIFVLTLAY